MVYEVAKIRDADGLEWERNVFLADDERQAVELALEYFAESADCDVPWHVEIVGEMPESQISK
jgi:hypothetical protein